MIDAEYLQKRLTFGFLVMVSFMGAKRSENPLAFVAIFMCNKIRKLHTNKPPDMHRGIFFLLDLLYYYVWFVLCKRVIYILNFCSYSKEDCCYCAKD